MNFILDLLFPKKCVGCNQTGTYFCSDCITNIKQGELLCPNCDLAGVFGETHPLCKTRFSLDGLWSLGLYQEALKQAIQKLKYKPSLIRDLAPIFSDLIVNYWKKHQPMIWEEIKRGEKKNWAVVPIPLHWFRENDRGFNQSALIGQLLSKNLGLDYCEALKRTRFTKPQVKLKSKDRKKNIRGAFAISSNCNLPPEACILLVDDVWTTGSTMKECCKILKQNGASRVWAITLAR